MKRQGTTTKTGGRIAPAAAVLQNVTECAARVRRVRKQYRLSLAAAADVLEAEGCENPYVLVARAAGVSRQSAREMVERVRAERPA